MPDVTELVEKETPDLELLGAELDRMSDADRIRAVYGMGAGVQKRLRAAARENRPTAEITFLVPESVPTGKTVVFYGKNSLPLFSHFQKRFCRQAEEADVLAGYNHQSLSWLTGPGYFLASTRDGRLQFDYRTIPDEAADGWPKLRTNNGWISRFVYKDMVDYCYPIGKNTLIGEAWDGPSETYRGQTFLLTRGEVL